LASAGEQSLRFTSASMTVRPNCSIASSVRIALVLPSRLTLRCGGGGRDHTDAPHTLTLAARVLRPRCCRTAKRCNESRCARDQSPRGMGRRVEFQCGNTIRPPCKRMRTARRSTVRARGDGRSSQPLANM
jgi:hypothetical protein